MNSSVINRILYLKKKKQILINFILDLRQIYNHVIKKVY